MRRLLAIAFLAALPAAAQIHGVPASVTSITPGRPTPGVPASVTSLGPNGFVDPMFRPSVDPMFRNPAFGNRCCGGSVGWGGRFGPGHHRGPGHYSQRRAVVPYVPYYYYPYYAVYPDTYTEPASVAESEAEDEEPPAPTIYEHRSRVAYSTDKDRYGEHYTDYREQERRRQSEEDARQAEEDRRRGEEARKAEAAEAARREEPPVDQGPAAVLVFKDGHHQDVSGYAITGDVLYDLGQGRARKIQLADLDLAATTKLNHELGNDFRLPVRQKN